MGRNFIKHFIENAAVHSFNKNRTKEQLNEKPFQIPLNVYVCQRDSIIRYNLRVFKSGLYESGEKPTDSKSLDIH